MTRNPLLIDLAIAVACAAVVLIISPGVAVDAIIAAIVLSVCGVSLMVSRRRGRATRRPVPGYGAGEAVQRRRRLR